MRTTILLLLTLLTTACGERHRPRIVADGLPALPAPVSTAPATTAAAAPAQIRSVETRVEPSAPPPLPPDRSPAPRADLLRRINSQLQDAFFDYDQHTLRPDAQEVLRHNAGLLHDTFESFGDLRLLIEGHCDERGSAEYNLALGDLRARAAMNFLAALGLPAARFQPISFGRERPQCHDPVESCYQKNRRAHLAVQP